VLYNEILIKKLLSRGVSMVEWDDEDWEDEDDWEGSSFDEESSDEGDSDDW
jgi:hypothetical protein